MATFTLTIKLGNAEMQTGDDVAEALRSVAESLDGWDTSLEESWASPRVIRDLNGNQVGTWAVSA